MSRNLIGLLIVVSVIVLVPGAVQRAHRARIERQAAAQMAKTNALIDSVLEGRADNNQGVIATIRIIARWVSSLVSIVLLGVIVVVFWIGRKPSKQT